MDTKKGLDHGVWMPLLHLWPDNQSVPVLSLSLPATATAARVRAIGKALGSLRASNVLLIGSGGAVHNLAKLKVSSQNTLPDAWAARFISTLKGHLIRGEYAAIEATLQSPDIAQAHPTLEHYLPLFFSLGAHQPEDRFQLLCEGFQHGNLSMLTFALQFSQTR